VRRWIVAAAALALVLYPVLSDDLYYQNMVILSWSSRSGRWD
jgi:hypothetical protein